MALGRTGAEAQRDTAVAPREIRQEAQRLHDALAEMSRDAGTFDARRYFRGADDLEFYNVGNARVRELAKATYRACKDTWPLDAALQLADILIRDAHLEVKGVGLEVVACYRRQFVPSMLATLKGWLARNDSSNWATTDLMCGFILGPLLAKYPDLIPEVAAWTSHRNMWVRRASVVGLIVPMRKGLALDELYAAAKRLHPDGEDLIHKAVGWALREAGRRDLARLERYLRAEGTSIPRTTLRYALEHMSPAIRADIMAATRPARTRR